MIKLSKTKKSNEPGKPQQPPICVKQTDKIFILKEQKPDLAPVPRVGNSTGCHFIFLLNVLNCKINTNIYIFVLFLNRKKKLYNY